MGLRRFDLRGKKKEQVQVKRKNKSLPSSSTSCHHTCVVVIVFAIFTILYLQGLKLVKTPVKLLQGFHSKPHAWSFFCIIVVDYYHEEDVGDHFKEDGGDDDEEELHLYSLLKVIGAP